MNAPVAFWCVTAFVFGVTIGSFLNVVIWRLPRGESIVTPPSHCPNCDAQLEAVDLVPLLSFLLLGCKCRRCKAPISWRYFSIELLTGLLFLAITWRFYENAATAVAMLLFAAVLIPIYFIDLATFEIHNSLNLMVFGIALGRDIYGIAAHESGHELLGGWLPRSVAGAALGAGIFGAVRIAGWLWKRQEAMGLGDVLLGRAMGAMLVSLVPIMAEPLRLFPAWVMLSSLTGALVGPAMLWWRARHAAAEPAPFEPQIDEEDPEPSTLSAQFKEVAWVFYLGDAWEGLQDLIHPSKAPPPVDLAPPAPTAIPFGPFLVIGFLAVAFFGERLTALYLAYAFPGR